jgi:hypothetical protein
MPHKPTALETIGLLIGLLPNHYPKACPCQRCRCRCHRLRSAQIDTTPEKEFTPQRAEPTSPPRTTRTYDQGRSPHHKHLIRQRDTPPTEEEILIRRTSPPTPTTTRKKKTHHQRRSQSPPVKTRTHHHTEDLPKPRKGILLGESSKLPSQTRGRTTEWLQNLNDETILPQHNPWQASQDNLPPTRGRISPSRPHIRTHSQEGL